MRNNRSRFASLEQVYVQRLRNILEKKVNHIFFNNKKLITNVGELDKQEIHTISMLYYSVAIMVLRRGRLRTAVKQDFSLLYWYVGRVPLFFVLPSQPHLTLHTR